MKRAVAVAVLAVLAVGLAPAWGGTTWKTVSAR